MSAIARLSRRQALRGMFAGSAVSVALPFLDCFLNENGTALAATGAPLPVRFGTWFWGLGLNPGRWEPKQTGKFTDLGYELKALEKYKDKINVFSGLKVHLDGRPAVTHFTGNMALLTGTTPKTMTVMVPTIDTLVADQIGTTTRFRSLEITSTGNPKHSYSFRAGNVFQPGEASPKALYARIFGPEFKDPNAADFKPDPVVMAQQSVLSAVKDQRQDLAMKLGAADRARLDEYFTSLRQLEQQLELQLEKPAPLEACSVTREPPEATVGTEIDTVVSNHRLLVGLLAHAVACDQTRVVNMVFSDATSSLRRAGSPMMQHIYSHEEAIDATSQVQPNFSSFAARAMEGLAATIETFDNIKEGDGTLLDRMAIMSATDTGYAKVHALENIPMVTAGRAGGRLKTGYHVRSPGDPTNRVGLTVMQAMGLPLSSWGSDSMETSKSITEVLA
jgi:hypothetical protein